MRLGVPTVSVRSEEEEGERGASEGQTLLKSSAPRSWGGQVTALVLATYEQEGGEESCILGCSLQVGMAEAHRGVQISAMLAAGQPQEVCVCDWVLGHRGYAWPLCSP